MKQFFITFFANLAALLFVFGGPMLLFVILMIASFSSSSKNKRMVSIERGSILVFDLSVNVTDSPEHATPTSPLSQALSGNQNKSIELHRLTVALRKAAKDERIKALFLQGSFQPADFGTGYACLKELREAILDFKKGDGKTPKKVYAYMAAPTTRDYYVMSTASTIYMNPYGEMEIPGLAVIKTYYAGAMEKAGVDVQVTRVGQYKSAVEPFILTKMSDADRKETQDLIDDLWGEFVNTVCQTRNIDPSAFQQLVNTEGYILPESALGLKLVDKLAYFGDVLNVLGKEAPASDYSLIPLPFKQVDIQDYINATRPSRFGTDDVVAVLYLEGEIVDGEGDTSNIGGDRFAAELRRLRRDKDVKAVVLRVNSPGGSAFASEVIQNEVIALMAAKKPVVVSMGNYAASGGYWISTYSDHIFAEPNTITGSIGVFGLFMNVQKLGTNVGITWDSAKTGTYADFETISRPKTPEELTIAQSRVDDLYHKFLTKVSESRHITPLESLDLIAQGRVWAGNEALRLKLVDEIGGLNNAIDYAAARAKLGTKYRVKEYPEQLNFAEALALLLNNQSQPVSKAKADPFTREFLQIKSDLKELQDFNDPMGMYLRMPLGWDIR